MAPHRARRCRELYRTTNTDGALRDRGGGSFTIVQAQGGAFLRQKWNLSRVERAAITLPRRKLSLKPEGERGAFITGGGVFSQAKRGERGTYRTRVVEVFSSSTNRRRGSCLSQGGWKFYRRGEALSIASAEDFASKDAWLFAATSQLSSTQY